MTTLRRLRGLAIALLTLSVLVWIVLLVSRSRFFADGIEMTDQQAASIREGLGLEKLKFVHGWRTAERDSQIYLLLQGTSEQVSAAKASVLAAPLGKNVVNDADDFGTFPFTDTQDPAWWLPRSLPDPDVLAISSEHSESGLWFVFSKKTGQVYVYVWTT